MNECGVWRWGSGLRFWGSRLLCMYAANYLPTARLLVLSPTITAHLYSPACSVVVRCSKPTLASCGTVVDTAIRPEYTPTAPG